MPSPATTALLAFPRPLRSQTTLSFELPVATDVRINVFDATGRRVAELIDRHFPAGPHALTWDGRGASGPVRSGVYFVRLTTAGQTRSLRLDVIR